MLSTACDTFSTSQSQVLWNSSGWLVICIWFLIAVASAFALVMTWKYLSQERNQKLKSRAAQLEKQIKVLIDDSVALLKARMSELGINASSPGDLLAKAKEIVLRHKELQAKASKLQAQVYLISCYFMMIYWFFCRFACCPENVLIYKVWCFIGHCWMELHVIGLSAILIQSEILIFWSPLHCQEPTCWVMWIGLWGTELNPYWPATVLNKCHGLWRRQCLRLSALCIHPAISAKEWMLLCQYWCEQNFWMLGGEG